MRKIPAAEARSRPNHTFTNTASRCDAGKPSIAASISGAIRTHNGISAGKSTFAPRPNQLRHPRRGDFAPIFRQTKRVTAKSQPAKTVFRFNRRARRAKTRKAARVASMACSEFSKRRSAAAKTNGK